ncbi:hypothetical protein BC938DRAFT_479692 [Jimgerdemannia flammicorona]|uniref:Uncharacterized protein n=1 Tax=Jimgerdemannia flammicorona TaxID=994334 RepID=A0A433QKC6_9FUNG|nr:hypothetical protein BC938DRAFT_479692 [Jimgerdemannia flammicorona]
MHKVAEELAQHLDVTTASEESLANVDDAVASCTAQINDCRELLDETRLTAHNAQPTLFALRSGADKLDNLFHQIDQLEARVHLERFFLLLKLAASSRPRHQHFSLPPSLGVRRSREEERKRGLRARRRDGARPVEADFHPDPLNIVDHGTFCICGCPGPGIVRRASQTTQEHRRQLILLVTVRQPNSSRRSTTGDQSSQPYFPPPHPVEIFRTSDFFVGSAKMAEPVAAGGRQPSRR